MTLVLISLLSGMTFAIPFYDFEQVSAPAGLAAGGTSQCGLDYTRIVELLKLGLLSGGEIYRG
jgi:hypothetical protein